jgi:hypothetical protein
MVEKIYKVCKNCVEVHAKKDEYTPCVFAEKWGIDLLDDCERLRRFYEHKIRNNIKRIEAESFIILLG